MDIQDFSGKGRAIKGLVVSWILFNQISYPIPDDALDSLYDHLKIYQNPPPPPPCLQWRCCYFKISCLTIILNIFILCYFQTCQKLSQTYQGGRAHWAVLLHQSAKFYNNVSLFVGLTTFRDFYYIHLDNLLVH